MFLPTKVHRPSPHQGPTRRLTWVKRVDESWGQDVQQRHWFERPCCHQNIQEQVWQQSRPSRFRNPTENPKTCKIVSKAHFVHPCSVFPTVCHTLQVNKKRWGKGMAKIARSMIRIRFLRRSTRMRKCLHSSRKWNQEPAAFFCLWLWMYAHIILASTNTASSEIISWFFLSLTTHTSPVQESILLLGHPSFCDYKINLHQNISLTSPCLHIAFHYSTIYQILGIFRRVRFHSMSIDNEKGG